MKLLISVMVGISSNSTIASSCVCKIFFYLVYDVHNFERRTKIYVSMVRNTQDTLRIGVISPMIFGTKQQNDDILNWAVKKDLLPTNW